MGRLWRILGAAALGAALLPVPVAHAGAVEQVNSYDVEMTVNEDGSMDVVETVEYDFGVSTDKHGFYRTLLTRQDYDDQYFREYPVTDIEVSSPTGAPDDAEVTDDSDELTTIRVGDADQTVSGVQTYRISYHLGGVVNGFDDHVELYWNVLGDGFDVAIEQASVQVTTPGDVTEVACYAGPVGSKSSCADSGRTGGTATFGSTRLETGEAFTVVVGMPKGAASAQPVLVERPSIRTDFGLSAGNIGGVAVALVLGALWALWVRRERARHGVEGSSAPAGAYSLATLQSGEPTSGALAVAPDGSVQFSPPGGLRPGQVGTLYDDRADTIDVTATIVDLAVRGYLVIDQLPDGDWGLRMLRPPGPEFLPYERKFFDALFLGKPDHVRLSSLRNTFAGTLGAIKNLMYDDMKRRGWFTRSRPDAVRKVWLFVGIGVAGVCGYSVIQIVTGAHAPIAAAMLAFALLGGGLIWGSRLIPAKSAAGQQAFGQVEAFKAEMESLDFSRLPEGSRDEVMSKYLPYAMAFGQVTRWTAACQALEVRHRPYVPRWYGMHGGWNLHHFTTAMTSFTATTGSTLASTPGGSGSSGFSGGGGGGFSGGGGGGGGGGSW